MAIQNEKQTKHFLVKESNYYYGSSHLASAVNELD